MTSYTYKGHNINIRHGKGNGRMGYITSIDGREMWIFDSIRDAKTFVAYWLGLE